MLMYAYMFARMYSRLAEGQLVVLSLHSDGRHIAIRVFDGGGGSGSGSGVGGIYEAFFSEEQIDDMKKTCNALLSWHSFFELLQRTFAEHAMSFELSSQRLTLTVKHERATEALPYQPFSATIVVKLARDTTTQSNSNSNGMSPLVAKHVTSGIFLHQQNSLTSRLDDEHDDYQRLCDEMISYAALRSGDPEEVDRLEDISKHEGLLSAQEAMLEAEVCSLEAEASALTAMRDYASGVDRQLLDADPPRRREIESKVAQSVAEDRFVDACWARADDPLRPHVEKLLGPLLSASGTYCKTLDGPLLQAIKGMHVGKEQHLLRCCDVFLTTNTPIFPTTPFALNISNGFAPAVLNSPLTSSLAGSSSDARSRVWTALATPKMADWCLDLIDLHKDCLDLPTTTAGTAGKAGVLVMMGYAVWYRLGLMAAFNISERVLLQWLSMLEAKHSENGIGARSVVRAASTLHAAFCLVTGSWESKMLNWRSEDVLALMMAACAQGFYCDTPDLIHLATRSNLAITFLDQFPSGSAAAFSLKELMKLPRYDMLQCVAPSRRREVERALFGTTLLRRSDDPVIAMEATFSQLRSALNAVGNGEITGAEAMPFVLPSVLLAAEVSVCARDHHQYQQWARLIQAHVIRLGEQEQAAGLQPRPLHGRKAHTTSVFAKHQLRLINCVVAPLYSTLFEIAPSLLRQTGELIGRNRSLWANAEFSEVLGESWK